MGVEVVEVVVEIDGDAAELHGMCVHMVRLM